MTGPPPHVARGATSALLAAAGLLLGQHLVAPLLVPVRSVDTAPWTWAASG